MKLELKRPICFYDLETTGVNPAIDRIVEIAILKVNPDGSKESFATKVNPGIPIPIETSKIHGIYDEDVKDSPHFHDLAIKIKNFIGDSDLGGYNCLRFDIPLLIEEFSRVEIEFDTASKKIVDVQQIFFKKEKRDLSSAYMFYCNKSLEGAHTAEADTEATYEVLLGQLEKYGDLEGNIDFLDKLSRNSKQVDFANRMVKNDQGEVLFNFGKHKGKKVVDILTKEPQYYNWIMNSDFPADTKKKLTDIRLKNFNNK